MPFYWFFLCLKAWSITEPKHNSNPLLCHIFTSTWKTSTDTKWNGNVPFKDGTDPPSPGRPINRPLLLEYSDYMGFRIPFFFGFGIAVFKALATSLKSKFCWQSLHLWSRRSSSLTVGISNTSQPTTTFPSFLTHLGASIKEMCFPENYVPESNFNTLMFKLWWLWRLLFSTHL